ncbi:MAG: Ig-like domain-containing protein, partial [Rhodocyclaceae bacterium]
MSMMTNPMSAQTIARAVLRKYLDAGVSISAPANNAKLGATFSVTGSASCEALQDKTGEPGLSLGDSTQSITAVDVRLGDAGQFQRAVPNGSGTTPWANWSFAAANVPQGPLTITVRVSAARTGFESDTATASRQIVIDLGPPSLSIDPPVNITRPAPPYTATITGTATDAAGVAAVEWRLGSGAFQAAAGTTNWSAAVALPGLGSHTISVRARDNLGNVSPAQDVTVKVIDATSPALGITRPEEGETFTRAGSSVAVEVRGTASDTQTGVALVEWALDGQAQFTPAVPKATDDWSTWSATIPIGEAGNHTITLRARDKVTPTANMTTVQRAVVVAEPFEPKDPETVFSAAAYLDDLLDFATRRAKTAATGGAAISRQLLVDTFLQPFTELVVRNNRGVANRPVHQVRLCIEGLRRYLAKHGRSIPAATEAAYRQAAYGALLRQLGTSHEEIRLARVADAAARAALASRLGIEIAQFRPDRLDQLLLQPNQLTEAALKSLFGLEETTLKPLADSVLPEPQLLIW